MYPTKTTLLLLTGLSLAACQSMPPSAKNPDSGTQLQPRQTELAASATDTKTPAPTTTAKAASSAARPASASSKPAVREQSTQLVELHKPGVIYQHTDGIEMRYNKRLGVYDVINMKDMYFHKQHYLRFANGAWLVATQFDGPWLTAKAEQIPKALAKSKPRNQLSAR